MKVNGILPSFQTIQKNHEINSGKSNPKAMQIAKELDKTANKYSYGNWKYQTPSVHYRNTFVEQQSKNYIKRLNITT